MDDTVGKFLNVNGGIESKWFVFHMLGDRMVGDIEHGISEDGVESFLADAGRAGPAVVGVVAVWGNMFVLKFIVAVLLTDERGWQCSLWCGDIVFHEGYVPGLSDWYLLTYLLSGCLLAE